MSSFCLRSRFPLSVFRRVNFARQSQRLQYPALRRHASTSTGTDSLLVARLKTILYGTALAGSFYVIYLYATDTRASVHRWLVPPLLQLVYQDAEDAHHAAISTLRTLYALDMHPRERERTATTATSPDLSVSVFGTALSNPIGISAGLDKHAEIPDALFALGAAIVEVGGCTPLPQLGNPRPRVFRIPSLDGMINRYGLNSLGADDMELKLRTRLRMFARSVGLSEEDVLDGRAGVAPGSLKEGGLLLVQIAKNKETDEGDLAAVARDYTYCVQRLGKFADVLVVNVSSPNTPGLRDLQATGPLTRLLTAVMDEASRTGRKERPKVMVKVSPDEDEDSQIEGIVEAVWTSGVDGVIVGNTTKRRTSLVPEGIALGGREQKALMETGGYSGPAMFDRTLDLVKRYRQTMDAYTLRIPSVDDTKPGPTAGQKAIFATGGITNGQQALEILNAGASVAMVYTGLVYGGAGTITRMKSEMRNAM